MSKLHTRNIYFFAITAALGGFLFGFDIAIISGAMPYFQEYFHLSTIELGLVNSSLLIGCILGSLIAGRVTDEFGRKKILVLVAVLFSLTSIGCAIAPSTAFLVFARFLGGLAVGAVSIASPMYIAEIAPSATRGTLMTFYQLSITAGILVSMLVNFILKDFEYNWQLMFASGIIPSMAFLLMLVKIPETPRFLIKKGNVEGAHEVLLKIGDEEYSQNIIPEIEASFNHHTEKLSDLWQPGIRKAVITSFVLAILVQITGIAAIIDYAPRILQSAGMSIDLALLNTIGIGVINFVFTIVSIFLIDRLGRKPLYVIGSSGLFLALIALSFIFINPQYLGASAYIICLIYIVFFASCMGPVFWTLLPEMLPNKVRGLAMTIPVLTQWFFNALVVFSFPVLLESFAGFTFLFMALMALFQILFTVKFIPETKQKSLEEIEKFWIKKN